MQNAPFPFDGIHQSGNGITAAPDHDHLGADLVAQVDMGGGKHMTSPMVL